MDSSCGEPTGDLGLWSLQGIPSLDLLITRWVGKDTGLASQGQIPWAPNPTPYLGSYELPIASQLWLLPPHDSTTPYLRHLSIPPPHFP